MTYAFTADNVPDSLKALPQWVCWRGEQRGGNTTKIPVNPVSRGAASSTNPATWTDYTTACAVAQQADLRIGFVFSSNDPNLGVDLDKCRNPETGEVEQWAQEIITKLNSYTELSPSGTGFHILIKASLPGPRNRKGQIEIYDRARFFCMTGDHLDGTPMTIEDRQNELNEVYVKIFPGKGNEQPRTNSAKPSPLTDSKILKLALSAKNRGKFQRLWAGEYSSYPSLSEADLALLAILTFYTQDPGQLDRLFRRSDLFHDKWDEKRGEQRYGERTIAKALETHLLNGGSIYRPAKSQAELIEELNQKHAVVMLQGKCLILNEVDDPCLGHKTITLSSPTDFRNCYSNRTVKAKKKPVNLAQYWLQHPDRRQYEGLVFAPYKDFPAYYNLWKGFGVEPQAGNCDLYFAHLLENIARQDTEIYWYLVHWMAHTVQHPGQRVGVSIALRGKQGTGKGITWKYFGNLFGPHFVHIANSRHLVGNFNAHLSQAIVVFADEAFWAGDKAGEGQLKSIVTEETLPIEFKGRDVFFVKNHVHLLIASNHDWVIPAALEERRFFTIDVGEDHQQDHAYFKAITDQMEQGGSAALLDYLLKVDVTNVNLRDIPQTEALMENKFLTMPSTHKFWYEKLLAGSLLEQEDRWQKTVVCDVLHQQFVEHAERAGQSRRSSQTELGMTLKKLCPEVQKRTQKFGAKKVAVWEFPDLQPCRDAFDQVTKYRHPWPRDSVAMTT